MAGQSSLQYETAEEAAQRQAREARRAARVAKQNRHQESSARYTNGNSSSQRNHDFQYQDLDEPYSPSSDGAIQEAVLVKQPQHQGQGRRGSAAYENNSPTTMPPGYPGPPMEDVQPQHPQQQQQQQPQHRTGPPPSARRPPPGGGSSSQGSSRGGPPSSSSAERDVPNGHVRGPSTAAATAAINAAALEFPPNNGRAPGGPTQLGSRISRLESPSVTKSVLQPLEKKIGEYERLMADARGEMTNLDQEIRALQERRQQAEDRFLASKAKHDDYTRQHSDVERAMRGEFEHRNVMFADAGMAPAPVPAPMPQLTPGAIRSAPSLVDEERPQSRQSDYEYKQRPRDRLRFSSLFSRH